MSITRRDKQLYALKMQSPTDPQLSAINIYVQNKDPRTFVPRYPFLVENARQLLTLLNQLGPCELGLKLKCNQPNDREQFPESSMNVVNLLEDILNKNCTKIRNFPSFRLQEAQNKTLLGMLLLLRGTPFAKDATDVNASDDHHCSSE